MRRFGMAAISFAILLLLSSVGFSQACSAAGSIVSVTSTTSWAFEYVTFKLKKPVNSGYGYSVSTATSPFVEDPSGTPVVITGPKYKKIKFQGITWMCTITENFSLPKIEVKDIKRIEQHEGVVVYVVGHKRSSHYRGTTTSNYGAFRKVVMKFRR